MTDREKVIEALQYLISGECTDTQFDYLDEIEAAIAMLKEQEWYMLTEDDDGVIHGLPGDDGQYLMTDGIDTWIDYYVDGVSDGIILDSGRDIREITAWKYMPELPKKNRG